MAAEGLLTLEELRAKLTELQEIREATERELENLRSRKERLEELEKDRDALLESLVTMIPASLDTLSGQERNKVYRMLRLIVMPAPEGYEVSGALCTTGPCSPSWFQNTKVPELRFRALLTDGAQEVRFERVAVG